jgi:hypothetical protein
MPTPTRDPSHVAADWCALWFHMCIYKAYHDGTERHPWHWWLTAANEFESLNQRRASDYHSELWGPQSTWPLIPEETPQCPRRVTADTARAGRAGGAIGVASTA